MSQEKEKESEHQTIEQSDQTNSNDQEAARQVEQILLGEHAKHRESLDNEVGLQEYIEIKKLGLSLTPQSNRRIRLKLDLHILSIFFITSILQFLDKTALNYANLFQLQPHLHLSSDGSQYSWLASLFYFGYLVAQFPASYLFAKYSTGKILGICTFFWGITILVFAFSKNFAGAAVCRVLLGVFEAPITPGITLAVGYWWTRAEAPLRYTFIYSALGWAGIIGSLMSTGISKMNDDGPVEKWQLVFVILGSLTSAWGVLVYFILPDSPVTASFLSHEEKLLATARVAGNQVGIKSGTIKLYQAKQALLDVKTCCIVLSTFAAGIPNGVISNFSTQIIKSLGFSTTKTTLMDCVGNSFQVVALAIGGYIASRIPNTRILVSTAGNIACLVAAACLAYLPIGNTWRRLVAFWWVNVQTVSFSLALNMISVNISGYTKKQLTSALTFIAYCVGNIVGPHFVISTESPRWPTATKAMLAGFAAKVICHGILGIYLVSVNWSRDKKLREQGVELGSEEAGKEGKEKEKAEDQGMLDLTEFENKAMRYVL